jgi:hypothetical protein
MNAKQLWDKILAENTGYLDKSAKKLTPTKEYRIKGDIVQNLIKDDEGKISINLKHAEEIIHKGENIDYSLYGTPEHSMGD